MDHRCYVNIDMRQMQQFARMGSWPSDGITTCVNVSPPAIHHPGTLPDCSDFTRDCGLQEQHSKHRTPSPRSNAQNPEQQQEKYINSRGGKKPTRWFEPGIPGAEVICRFESMPQPWEAAMLSQSLQIWKAERLNTWTCCCCFLLAAASALLNKNRV